MKKVIALAGLFFFGAVAAKDCNTIADSDKRLACYDEKYPVKKTEKAKKTTQIDLSHWTTKSETSKIDDTKTVMIYNESPDVINGRFEVTQPVMIVVCQNNRTKMYFNWRQSLKTDLYGVNAKVRFGKNKPRNYRFSASTDFDAAFVSKPIAFIKKAFKHETMVVQMSTAYAGAESATFNLRGFEEVIKPLRKSCNW